VNILGVGVHAINPAIALEVIEQTIAHDKKGYVCVTGVHGIMESQHDEALRQVENNSLLTTPDGMPTVWIGKLRGHREMARVYGPDLMLDVCKRSVEAGWSHFFYGGAEGVADELKAALEKRYPGLRVAGTYGPPFRPLNPEEEQELIDQVAACKPDIVWVGISTPKQEKFAAEYLSKLDTHLLIAVGAAFDFHTGRAVEAPGWMKRSGLQWFHRMMSNPRRLARRYLTNNPLFVLKFAGQCLGLKKYSL
jgi:N-acetylglucosaminyldiphosphoundecaprenol N-acetyl-beta-D-mannosaminyltransferase